MLVGSKSLARHVLPSPRLPFLWPFGRGNPSEQLWSERGRHRRCPRSPRRACSRAARCQPAKVSKKTHRSPLLTYFPLPRGTECPAQETTLRWGAAVRPPSRVCRLSWYPRTVPVPSEPSPSEVFSTLLLAIQPFALLLPLQQI